MDIRFECVTPDGLSGKKRVWFQSYDLFMMVMFRLLPNAKLAILLGGHGEYIGEITAVKEGSKLPEMIVAMIEEFLDVL